MQVLGGIGSFGQEGGGVAYAAHIGGFVAGLVLVKLFASNRQAKVAVQDAQAHPGRGGYLSFKK